MTNWNEITVETFKEIRGIYSDTSISVLDKDLHLLSILTETDIEELEEMDYNELKELGKSFEWVQTPPKDFILTEFNGMTYKGFVNLTLGEYIEYTYLFGDMYNNFDFILAVAYRKENESYNYNPQERRGMFLNEPVTHFIGVFNDFIKFKTNFEESYKDLFEPNFEEEELDELDPEDKKQIQLEKLHSKWAWERLIDKLCNGDLTKYSDVLDLPLYLVFNNLSMKKDLGIE